MLVAAIAISSAAHGQSPTDPFSFPGSHPPGPKHSASVQPAAAETITMTNWSFTTGGLNFQLIGGNFASTCDGQLMLDNTSGGSDLYSNTWNDLTQVGPIVITGLTVGANYVLYVRAWTGETGWESLPWVQYGTQWTQPTKNDDPIEQEE